MTVLEAIRFSPMLIRYIESPTEEMYIEAIKKDSVYMECVKYPTKKINDLYDALYKL